MSLNFKDFNSKRKALLEELHATRITKLKSEFKENLIKQILEEDTSQFELGSDDCVYFELDSDDYVYDERYTSNRLNEYNLQEIGDAFQSLADELDDGFESDIHVDEDGEKIVRYCLMIKIRE